MVPINGDPRSLEWWSGRFRDEDDQVELEIQRDRSALRTGTATARTLREARRLCGNWKGERGLTEQRVEDLIDSTAIHHRRR